MWTKIKLIWKGRAIAENLLKIKSRWKDPSFWLALLGNIGSIVGYLKGVISPQAAIVINTATGALVNYVRGIQKAQTDGVKPYRSSSEFWLGIGALDNNCFVGLQGQGIDPAWLATSSVVLGHSLAAARDLANMRPKEVTEARAPETH